MIKININKVAIKVVAIKFIIDILKTLIFDINYTFNISINFKKLLFNWFDQYTTNTIYFN